MFDKLDDMLIHYEELMLMLGDPDVTQDTKRFTRLMKEQADLAPIVEAYKQYKQAKQDVEDSLALLEEENDEEMREMAKEELSGCCGSVLNLFEERFNHHPRLYRGPLESECQEILQGFFQGLRENGGENV